MKKVFATLFILLTLAGCQQSQPEESPFSPVAHSIHLSDGEIQFDGESVSQDPSAIVYTAHDIVYYPAGKDFTFGEGTESDSHEPAEADAHTVVHITKPGTYKLTGTLSAGQIAIDLGKDAKNDPESVVELILDNVDITCTVAPAVIFYNVYECGDKDTPTKDVDTAEAGAIVRIADGSANTINGSYVARIYKPESVELNEAKTEVTDAKKLHKYDAAFYSKMSMNIFGNDGILNIHAENEGLDSEMHLTINGGDIRIESGNDGINTNEDGVSVTTINGGTVSIHVNGATGEGDGIDSNGWLVINGGTVISAGCSFSPDAGIDSDMGIHINGGTVIASGNMLDRISESRQSFAVFHFAQPQSGGHEYRLSGAAWNMKFTPTNDFTCLVVSSPELQPGEYQFFCGETQLAASNAEGMDGMGNREMPGPDDGKFMPDNMSPPKVPEGSFMPPDAMERTENNMSPPEGMGKPPEGFGYGESRNKPENFSPAEALSPVFSISVGGNYFFGLTAYQ